MPLKFIDDEHKSFYYKQVEKTNSGNDAYRKALFYTLGLTAETRRNINNLYDFKGKGIDFDGLRKPWQTSTSMRVTRLAFNLYNGFNGELEEGGEDPSSYTPYNIFDCGLMPYMFEAVKLLYPCYAREV